MNRNWSLIADRLHRDGDLLTLAQAAKLLPAHGRNGHPTAQAMQRWIVLGKRGVYLDGVKCGRGWATTRSAILRFLAECSERAVVVDAPALTDMERRAEAAKARLLKMPARCG